MKMIWPGRALGVALLVPALVSLTLLVSEDFLPLVLVIDTGGRRWWRFSTCSRSGGPGGSRVERRMGAGLLARRARRGRADRSKTGPRAAVPCGLRDDVPDEFTAEPASFELKLPAKRQAMLTYRFVPKRRGTYRFERVDALIASRLGFWRRQSSWPLRTEVRVYPDIHQLARYYDAGAARPAEHDRRAPVAAAGNRQRVRAAARLHRGRRSRGTSTGGPRPGGAS